jgi:hypothetical protein
MFNIPAQFNRARQISQAPGKKQQIFWKPDAVRRLNKIRVYDPFHKEARFAILMLQLLGVLPVQASPTTGRRATSS